ncbi:MAG TPA: hypothetical protein VFC86_13850 [Planctomycetota bacterium]|nr:hypothetical protein [Planctomycetota bacterium]
MAAETAELRRLTFAEHPENRVDSGTEIPTDRPETGAHKVGLGRALFGMGAAGFVGSLLTLMTVAHPLGAGDTVAALSMLPMALTLICIVNGWIAASLFLSTGLRK